MTATLRLSISGEAPRGAHVPAVVRSLDGGLERKVLIPIGPQPEPEVMYLMPGSYFVEAFLPSGELLRKFVDLQDAPESGVDIQLIPSRSPHEWLAFQHLLVTPERLRAYHPQSVLESFSTPDERATVRFLWPLEESTTQLVEMLFEPKTPERLAQLKDANPPPRRVASDGTVQRFVLPPQKNWSSTGALWVRFPGKHVCVPVPSAWLTLHHHLAPIEVVVNQATDSVSTTVADPTFAPVLGYLGSGYSELAVRALGNAPLTLLFEKFMNPFAAAAGAHVLVQSWLANEASGNYETGKAPWREWVWNLANYFDFLPDGAILEGRLLLASDSPQARDEAAARFVEAYERGVPYFAAGLRMLLEGLLGFEDEQLPPELQPRFALARRHVRQWATWMDPREPFTTLHIPLQERP